MVAVTDPSTEFSSGTIAALDLTAAHGVHGAASTVAYGDHVTGRASRPSSHCRSAASVKVPAGPRKP